MESSIDKTIKHLNKILRAVSQYDGKPCKVCGETLRYKSNKRCVACKHEMDAALYQQRKARKQIAEQWQRDARYGHTESLQPAYFIERGDDVDTAISKSKEAAVQQAKDLGWC